MFAKCCMEEGKQMEYDGYGGGDMQSRCRHEGRNEGMEQMVNVAAAQVAS